MRINTVADLLEYLADFDPSAPVRLASQPSWPMEHYVGRVAETGGAVYIGEGSHIGYLSGEAAADLEWD